MITLSVPSVSAYVKTNTPLQYGCLPCITRVFFY